MGTCSWPENMSKRLIQEVTQGRDLAAQLQNLLHKPASAGERGLPATVSAEELADKILKSFTHTLSVLNMMSSSTSSNACNSDQSVAGAGAGGGDGSQINPEASHVDHSHCDDRSLSENSGESRKRPMTLKEKRGCYKRRKNTQSWTTVLPTIEDGQAWRKYGQKEILNAPYPRAYFRCTRKFDQGCRATRQVQQIQDNPKLYQTTYIGQHTCRNTLKAPQMIIKDSDANNPWELSANYKVISSDQHDQYHSRNSTINNPINSATDQSTLTTDQEVIKEETPSDHDLSSDNNNNNNNNNNNYLWPTEFKALELSDLSIGLLSPKMGSGNNEDVASIMFSFADRTASTGTSSDQYNLDMDNEFVVESIDFGDFDETEFSM